MFYRRPMSCRNTCSVGHLLPPIKQPNKKCVVNSTGKRYWLLRTYMCWEFPVEMLHGTPATLNNSNYLCVLCVVFVVLCMRSVKVRVQIVWRGVSYSLYMVVGSCLERKIKFYPICWKFGE